MLLYEMLTMSGLKQKTVDVKKERKKICTH